VNLGALIDAIAEVGQALDAPGRRAMWAAAYRLARVMLDWDGVAAWARADDVMRAEGAEFPDDGYAAIATALNANLAGFGRAVMQTLAAPGQDHSDLLFGAVGAFILGKSAAVALLKAHNPEAVPEYLRQARDSLKALGLAR